MNLRRSKKAARGQSVVEAVLGLLVFVTVLIFGIHFAELGYLSLKVEEAANFGLWHATGWRMHDTYVPEWSDWTTAVSRADMEVRALYPHYDAVSGAGGGVTYAFTRAKEMTMGCQQDNRVPSIDAALTTRLVDSYPTGNAAKTGMSCTAMAEATGFRIPKTFVDKNSSGFFKADHWNPIPITMCAAGRFSGGDCSGRFGLLLDDWGFSGPREGLPCPVMQRDTCPNTAYYQMVKNAFTDGGASGGRAASDLAAFVAGASPTDESQFFMSFVGYNDGPAGPFKDTTISAHWDYEWETTPYTYPNSYKNSYSRRSRCFLGMPQLGNSPCTD